VKCPSQSNHKEQYEEKVLIKCRAKKKDFKPNLTFLIVQNGSIRLADFFLKCQLKNIPIS